MTTKGKDAVHRRIKQLRRQLKCLGGIRIGSVYLGCGLEYTTGFFESGLKEVEVLVHEHGLEASLVEEFKSFGVNYLYERAGKEKRFDWQASFAKKYGL